MKVEIEMPQEGTRLWALLQIVMGKRVIVPGSNLLQDDVGEDYFTRHATGWRIYEEPLPVCRWKQHKPGCVENYDDDLSWVECDCISARGKTLNEAKARWREVNEK